MAAKKVRIDILAKDKTKAALRGVNKGLSNLKASVFNLKVALAGVGGGLVARSFLNTARDIEKLQVRLKFLFGSTEEGAKAFDKMAKFASRVPFSLGEIQQGAGVLAVVSKDANELAKIMELTGNVAAVTGLDFRTTSEQIQRSLSAGISAADLFREKGVKAMLGFKAGSTVSIEETVEAFDRVFGPDGKFGKATEELAKTFDGVLSMIGDKIFLFKRATMEAGVFDFLKAQLKALDQIIAENFGTMENAAEVLGEGMVRVMRQVMLGSARIIDVLRPVFSFIRTSVENMFNFLANIPPVIRAVGVLGFLMLGTKGKIMVATIAGFWDQIAGAFNNMMEAMGDTARMEIGSIKQKIGDLFTPLDMTWDQFLPGMETYIIGMGKMEQSVSDFLKRSDELIKQGKREEYELAKFAHLKKLRRIEALELLKSEETSVDRLRQVYESFGRGFTSTWKDATDLVKQFELAGKNAFRSFDTELKKALRSGKFNFQEFARSVIIDLTAIIIKQQMILFLQKAIAMFKTFSFGFGFFEKGTMASANTFQHGGFAKKGQPAIVGEAGPELIIPRNNSEVIPNNKLSDLGKNVTVNFNINTVDARGFNELLVNSRGVIVNMINSAVNEKGRMAIV